MKKNIIACGISLLCGLSLVSCDNEPFDLGTELLPRAEVSNKDHVAKVKFVDSELGLQFSGTSLSTTYTPVTVFTSFEELELTLSLTAPAPEDFTATLAVEANEAIRKEYQSRFGASFAENLAEGILFLENANVAFKAGETTAKVKVKVDKTKVTRDLAENTLAAIVVKSVSSSKVGVSNFASYFVSVSSLVTNIKPSEATPHFVGKTPLDLTSYDFVFGLSSTRFSSYFGSSQNAFDGRPETRWHLYTDETPINMNEYFQVTFPAQTISGLAIMPYNQGASIYTPMRNCTISVQVDGEWTTVGRSVFTPAVGVYTNLEFYTAVENCTGIRIHPNIGSTNRNVSIGELQLYP